MTMMDRLIAAGVFGYIEIRDDGSVFRCTDPPSQWPVGVRFGVRAAPAVRKLPQRFSVRLQSPDQLCDTTSTE